MAKGAPESPQGGGENSLDFLWLVVLILAAVALIWYFGKIYIAEIVLFIRSYEILVIKSVIVTVDKVLQPLGYVPHPQPFDEWLQYIKHNFGAELEFSALVNLSGAVGKYLRYPVMLLLLIVSAILYFSSVSKRFRTTFNMEELRVTEHQNWPDITPVINLDLVKEPLDQPPWAMALSPIKFCKVNKLFEETTKDNRPSVILKKGAATRVLSLQLGPRWQSPEALPEHLQALFAIFIARIDGDKISAERLVEQISASSEGKLSFHGVHALWQRHVNNKVTQRTMRLHGYVTGVLSSLLIAAREVGVLATAEFLWLKTIDRRMWYMLNSVGRPTAFAEVAGAFAHWLAERKLGLPLMVPMVDEAVRGLEVALAEVLYKPEED